MQQTTLEIPTLDEIKEVFFEAMLAGWVSTTGVKHIPELPGSGVSIYEKGEFKVADLYFVTPHSNKSGGVTTISFQGNPVWMMQYGGWYLGHVTPFLKSCLCKAYEKHKFYGGRGPLYFRSEGLIYENNIHLKDFNNFEGLEWISSYKNNIKHLGEHWYRGMSLLP